MWLKGSPISPFETCITQSAAETCLCSLSGSAAECDVADFESGSGCVYSSFSVTHCHLKLWGCCAFLSHNNSCPPQGISVALTSTSVVLQRSTIAITHVPCVLIFSMLVQHCSCFPLCWQRRHLIVLRELTSGWGAEAFLSLSSSPHVFFTGRLIVQVSYIRLCCTGWPRLSCLL